MGPPLRSTLALSLLLLLPSPGRGAVTDAAEWDVPSAGWRQGPVRYLLTGEETQAFKDLRTDGERGGFIAAFWARRDPTPETRRNEFREQFYQRVKGTESLRKYFSSTKAMWLSDLGRIYVLLGPPTSEQSSLMASSERDAVDWSYDGTGGHRGGRLTFSFVADETGELRLSSEPELDRATIQGLAAHTPVSPPPRSADNSGRTHTTPWAMATTLLAIARAEGTNSNYALQRLPEQVIQLPGMAGAYARVLMDDLAGNPGTPGEATGVTAAGRDFAQGITGWHAAAAAETEVRAAASFDPLPLEARIDFYRADDGTTYAAITLAPAEPPAGALLPFGGIISLDDPGVTYPLSSPEQYAAAGDEAPGTFQTGLGLDPGRYRVLFGLHEAGTGRVGTWERDLQVPDLGDAALRLSSLTLARSVAPLPSPPTPGLKVPFVLGRLRVVPRTDPALRNGDQFNLYYQVYGAQPAGDGQPHLRAVYRFQGRSGDKWIDLGRPVEAPDLTGAAQAWSFPVQGWPAGDFRLLLEVQDTTSGRSAGDLLEFRVDG